MGIHHLTPLGPLKIPFFFSLNPFYRLLLKSATIYCAYSSEYMHSRNAVRRKSKRLSSLYSWSLGFIHCLQMPVIKFLHSFIFFGTINPSLVHILKKQTNKQKNLPKSTNQPTKNKQTKTKSPPKKTQIKENKQTNKKPNTFSFRKARI